MKESYREGVANHLTSSLAAAVVRPQPKRRHEASAGRASSFGMSRRKIKADVFSGKQTHRGKSQNLVAWIAGRRETESLESIDKAIVRMASKSSGRNDQ